MLLETHGLTADAGEQRLLHPLDLAVPVGGSLVVFGDSGAGKSTLGLALLGAVGPGVRLGGRIRFAGADVHTAPPGRIGHLPQHPGAVLDPVRRVGGVLRELAATPDAVARTCAAARFDPDLLRRFPHQLSGGQQQRAALAMTLATDPAVVVLDEPTTGLDHGTAAELVAELRDLREAGTALVLLTHDESTARALGGRAIRLAGGRVVARGEVADLLRDEPGAGVRTAGPGRPRLRASGLRVADRSGRPVLHGVDLEAGAGELVALVGRSGAGKTTVGRSLAGLVAAAGVVTVDGQVLPARLERRNPAQRRAVQYVHQDPRATFRAHRSVLEQVARPAVLLRGETAAAARAEAAVLLAGLGVNDATAARGPRSLSGGQLQRAAVARALLARPAVLVGDEITSALDPAHRARLLAALDTVRREHGTAVVLISHDLPLVEQVADRVVVLADGRVATDPPADA